MSSEYKRLLREQAARFPYTAFTELPADVTAGAALGLLTTPEDGDVLEHARRGAVAGGLTGLAVRPATVALGTQRKALENRAQRARDAAPWPRTEARDNSAANLIARPVQNINRALQALWAVPGGAALAYGRYGESANKKTAAYHAGYSSIRAVFSSHT